MDYLGTGSDGWGHLHIGLLARGESKGLFFRSYGISWYFQWRHPRFKSFFST